MANRTNMTRATQPSSLHAPLDSSFEPSLLISFKCVLKDKIGNVISTSYNHKVEAPLTKPDRGQVIQQWLSQTTAVSSLSSPISSPLSSSISTSGTAGLTKVLWERLQTLNVGDKTQFQLSAEKAFGLYDSTLVMELPRKRIPHGASVKIGDQVVADALDGMPVIFRVTQASENRVLLDGNHPLAGQDLIFEIEVTEKITNEPQSHARSLAPLDDKKSEKPHFLINHGRYPEVYNEESLLDKYSTIH